MMRVQSYSFYITITLLTLALSCTSKNQESGYEKINSKRLSELIANSDIQLVDIRTREEMDRGMISGAIEFNFFDADFSEQISTLDKNKPLVLYCHSGKRSAKASGMLKDLGFTKIYDLDKGFSGWQSDGLPVVK